jgi:subtilisin family serine protease
MKLLLVFNSADRKYRMQRYAILRNMATGQRTASPFESLGPHVTAAGIPEPQVDVQVLERKEVVDIARDPQVQSLAPVMPTTLIKPLETATAPTQGDAWGIAAVQADTSRCTGDGVVVAILDTGIDKTHPAFNGVNITEQDFSRSGNGDRQGHGSHCAGTIFGRDIDGRRIGIARGVNRALIGKVLSDNGGGDSDMIFQGIQWAIQQGAKVISMSLGFDFPGMVDKLVKDEGWPNELAASYALEAYRANLRMFDSLMRMAKAMAAFQPGAVIVAAAGNESKTNINPNYKIAASIPAAAEGVLSVGALQHASEKYSVAFFSNTFPQLAAPGVEILSVNAGGGLRTLSGTSMACPHVAGVAALWWDALQKSGNVRPTAELVMAKLRATARADSFDPSVAMEDRGAGLVTAPRCDEVSL